MTSAASAASPIRYTVRIPAPASHYIEVEARIPVDGKLPVEIFLPVWTPGSYMVREYARNIEGLTAADGTGVPLAVSKSRKNRWRIQVVNPIHEVVVSYRLYCHELSVRNNWVDDQFALLNGAATFLEPVNSSPRQHEVKLELPTGWQGAWSGMPQEGNTFLASDYDMLVDSPILAGSPSVHPFEAGGKPHFLINQGEAGLWDGAKAVADLEKIVLQYRAMWGSLPYEKYIFFNVLTGPGGGIEHRNSVMMMNDRFAMRSPRSYLGWLDLASHEFFHLWNVKRLRPMELGPFDYENEVYTRNLWISEGFTDYYGALTVRRAGLSTDEEFLGTSSTQQRRTGSSLTGLIEELQRAPGRLRQSASSASYDAWIKLYRPDENSPNSSISYYTKGALIGWLLDAKIRAATNDAKSLDDLMRIAFQRFAGPSGFTDQQFRETAGQVAGIDLTDWFRQAVDSTHELEYTPALTWFGLRFKPLGDKNGDNSGDKPNAQSAKAPRKVSTGFSTKNDAGRLIVARVLRDTPAEAAGVSADDEILGIDGYRVRPDQWEQRMEEYRAKDKIELLVSRNDRLLTLPLTLEEEPRRQWIVEADPHATPEQTQHFNRWVRSLR